MVDARVRVRGIDGLRIADASIMPTWVGGNTNAPTIMIGETAAELIRSDARQWAQDVNAIIDSARSPAVSLGETSSAGI